MPETSAGPRLLCALGKRILLSHSGSSELKPISLAAVSAFSLDLQRVADLRSQSPFWFSTFQFIPSARKADVLRDTNVVRHAGARRD